MLATIKYLRWFCTGSLSLWLSVSSAFVDANESAIPLFTANYQADIKGFRVNATRELQNSGNGQQVLVFKADSMIATLEESTRFSWENGRIKPLRYDYSHNVIGKKESRSIEFNHKAQEIISKYRGKQSSIPYASNLHDTLSYQLQLQQDLLTGTKALSYSVVRRNKTKPNQFEIEAEELLDTDIGQLRTVKVSFTHDSDEQETYIWFAKDWNYLLVRFEQFEDGKKEFVINLTDATIAGQSVSGLSF